MEAASVTPLLETAIATPALRQALQNDDDYRTGDVHQAILNIAYSDWQNKDKGISNYGQMIGHTEESYGKLAAFAVLAGKHNQQVGNGGHMQYFDNGYADGQGGFGGKHDTSNPLHQHMIDLMVEFGLAKAAPIGQQALEIYQAFEIEIDNERWEEVDCESCHGSGQEETQYTEAGEPIEKSCEDCGGSGREEIDNENYGMVDNTHLLDALDTKWYAMADQYMTFLNEYFKRAVA